MSGASLAISLDLWLYFKETTSTACHEMHLSSQCSQKTTFGSASAVVLAAWSKTNKPPEAPLAYLTYTRREQRWTPACLPSSAPLRPPTKSSLVSSSSLIPTCNGREQVTRRSL